MIKNNKILALFLFMVALSNQAFAQDSKEREILWTADWSSNGKFIAVGGNVDSLRIYYESNLKPYKSLPLKNTITRVKYHPTKNIIAVTTQISGDKSSIINLETNDKIELNGISEEGARGVDWNHTGEYLAVADNEGKISIFDIDGNLIRQIKHDNSKSITSIAWHPKKDIFITVGDKIRMYDLNGELLETIVHRKEETLLLCVSWHKSGDFFVTGDYGDNQNNYKPLLQFWNSKGELLKSISSSIGEYRNLAWNPKGDRLATASDALRIWSKEGTLLYEGVSKDYLWGVSWNKKGKRLVTSSTEQIVTIWNNRARKLCSDE